MSPSRRKECSTWGAAPESPPCAFTSPWIHPRSSTRSTSRSPCSSRRGSAWKGKRGSTLSGGTRRISRTTSMQPLTPSFTPPRASPLPNFRGSINQACKLIVPGGVLAISYYNGLFDAKGRDAVPLVFPELKYQYGAISYDDLMIFLKAMRGFRTAEFDYRFEIPKENLV